MIMRLCPSILMVLCLTASPVILAQPPDYSVRQNMDAVIATDKDNGTTVSLIRNGILIVKLEAQLGSGYGWHVVKNGRLRLLRPPELETSSSGLPGGTERQIFRFKARTLGSSRLELRYIRPWEKGAQPLKTYSLEIEVKPKPETAH